MSKEQSLWRSRRSACRARRRGGARLGLYCRHLSGRQEAGPDPDRSVYWHHPRRAKHGLSLERKILGRRTFIKTKIVFSLTTRILSHEPCRPNNRPLWQKPRRDNCDDNCVDRSHARSCKTPAGWHPYLNQRQEGYSRSLDSCGNWCMPRWTGRAARRAPWSKRWSLCSKPGLPGPDLSP